MATYPDDATAPVTAFGVVSTVAYTNTGAVEQILIWHQLLIIEAKL